MFYIYIHLCITCIDTNVSVHTVKRMPEDTYLWRKALPHGKKALHQLPAKWGVRAQRGRRCYLNPKS